MQYSSFLYVWTGVDARGRMRSGRSWQPHHDMLAARLARCGIVLTAVRYSLIVYVRPQVWRVWWARLRARTQLSLPDTALILRSLSQLLEAGVPLHTALLCLAASAQTHDQSAALTAVCERVELGHSFAQAVSNTASWWPAVVPVALTAGEGGGAVVRTLDLLSRSLFARQEAHQKVWRALVVPLLTTGVALCVLLALACLLIPQLCELLTPEKGGVPHGLERVMNVCVWLRAYGLYALFCLLVGCGLVWRLLGSTLWLVRQRDRMVYVVPSLGGLVSRSHTVVWLRMLSVLLAVGVPLVEALAAIEDVVGNACWAHMSTQLRQKLFSGIMFADACAGIPQYMVSPLFGQVVSGATSQRVLAGMCEHIAQVVDDELSHLVRMYVALLQPGLLIILAAGVALVLQAIIGPLLDMMGSATF